MEITSAEAEISKICGRSPRPLFRYPFGDSDKRVRALVASLGYQGIHWTLDSLDSVGKPKNADFVVGRILSKIKPGSITLMHVSRVESAKSLPRIFDYLDKNGIQVVPVSELLLSSANQNRPRTLAQNPPSTRR
jgi:peptidoglycan/xylan/chitin deacetylase (PgdA/CDA1 family)